MFSSFKIKKEESSSCLTKTQNEGPDCCTPQAKGKVECPKCKQKAKGVLGKTLEHLLTDEAKAKFTCFDGFYFCKSFFCEVVYFRDETLLTQEGVSVVVGHKEGATPATVCYCFEWTKEKMKVELQETGQSTATEDIKHKMDTLGCSCEILNPSGGCCLGDVDKAVKDLKEELKQGKTKKHLIIVGGGSAAFSAAIEANSMNVQVTMINEGLPIGGTCVNIGCVPSKNLIRAAESLYKANNNAFDGIDTSATMTNFQALIEAKRNLVLDLREQKYINIIKDMPNFELIEGRAKLHTATSVKVLDRIIEGSHILVCTGARPLVPDIEGLSDVDYLTNEEAFDLDELPKSIILLGGGYIALEIAQMFSRLGSKVTILQRSERILSSEEEDLTSELEKYFKEEGMTIITGNAVKSINEVNGLVSIKTVVNGKELEVNAQKIIIATGRTANTDNMNLEKVGVKLKSNGAVQVDEYLQTAVPTIYAAGDVIGERMFVYTAAYEAKLAISNAFTPLKKEADFSVLPWVIFTDPQVAGVGMDEVQAKLAGIDYEVAVLPMSYVPRAIAANDTRGFIKLLRNKADDKLIGARILAPEGSELLMEIAVAIKFGITTNQLKDMLHPYLTLSEGIKLAAITFSKDVKELSCCAT